MAKTDVRGKVQTVLGLINGSQLRVTLPHKHFFIDSRGYMVEPTNPEKRSWNSVREIRERTEA